jgi:hypothetical protein
VTLSDIANFSTVISGIAVLASLIYLSSQIRQNTLAHRASALEGRRAIGREQILLSLNPATASLILRGNAADPAMTAIERFQYNSYVTAFFLGMDEAFWLHDQHILDPHAFDSQAHVLDGYLRQPGGRIVWQLWKPRASPAFRAHVEARLPALAKLPAVTFDQRWQVAAAAAAESDA